MTIYIFAVLGLVALCVLWAFFQLWLNRIDPDAEARPIRCGGCSGHCEE